MTRAGIIAAFVACSCGRVGFDASDGRRGAGDGGDDGALVARSCDALAPTCGPAGTASCCASAVVPGGSVYRGYDVANDNQYTDMTHPATVSAIRFDTYEITVGRFRAFVVAGKGTQQDPPAAGAGARTLNGTPDQAGWDPTWNPNLAADPAALASGLSCDGSFQTWTELPGGNEELPMNCISWYEAFAFCVWDGGFLPTEAEWDYAAGGGEQRAFPWSNPPGSLVVDCTYANYYPTPNYCVPPNGAANRVGSEPAGDGTFGHADLGDNLREWMLDSNESYTTPCNDCASVAFNLAWRIVRGGSFTSQVSTLRNALRFGGDANSHSSVTGARCARPL